MNSFIAKIAVLLSLGFVLNGVSPAVASPTPSPRLLIHLLDYLAKDYGGAVQDGKILSESEYREQMEFVERARTLQAQLRYPPGISAAQKAEIQSKLNQLSSLISSKADAAQVADLAHGVRSDVIRFSGIETVPAHTPDLARGSQIYSQRCTACHGVKGFGDGPAAAGLDPKPINFHDPAQMKGVAPLQIFHAVRLGVPGTAMAPLADLSDQDTWDVAYFVLSFRDGDGGVSGGAGGLQGDSHPLALARSHLKEADQAYHDGKFQIAQDRALAAYLEGFEPLEPKLKANDPEMVLQVEGVMQKVRESIDRRRDAGEVSAAVEAAMVRLDAAEQKLQHQDLSPWMSFSAAAAILLREGFEAVLVILAFLGVVRTSGNARAERWLHGGWIAALACGVVAWSFSGWLIAISGAQREAMEAVTGFLAAGILLFVGFWLHQKTEIHRWKSFVETQVKSALEQKSLFGLALISFIAVFRETLETVLFLRAIWVDCGPSARSGLFAGMACSFVAVLLMAWAALRFSRRIPIRQLFTGSSFLMAALAVILVGKGAHSFQETGTFSITSAPFSFRLDLLGIYPTWESLICQLLVIAIIAGLWRLGRKPAVLATTAKV